MRERVCQCVCVCACVSVCYSWFLLLLLLLGNCRVIYGPRMGISMFSGLNLHTHIVGSTDDWGRSKAREREREEEEIGKEKKSM